MCSLRPHFHMLTTPEHTDTGPPALPEASETSPGCTQACGSARASRFWPASLRHVDRAEQRLVRTLHKGWAQLWEGQFEGWVGVYEVNLNRLTAAALTSFSIRLSLEGESWLAAAFVPWLADKPPAPPPGQDSAPLPRAGQDSLPSGPAHPPTSRRSLPASQTWYRHGVLRCTACPTLA